MANWFDRERVKTRWVIIQQPNKHKKGQVNGLKVNFQLLIFNGLV